MKRMNGAGTRLLQTVREFTVAQRTLALIGVAVFALGAVALGNWLLQPSYQPLYTGLDASDASAVVAQLEKDKVPYQLDGTGTILVPAADVSQERLAAAAAGLPSNTDSGYALLDKLGVTASEFQQNVTYKRAIEGELAQTIESIQGVSSAAVLLAIPQQTVFSDDTQNPTASVTLNVTTPLTASQVQAITHLVSASYPGLTESNVTVVDQKGDLLSSDGASGSGAQDANTYEASTEAAVQAMLDRVLGPGNSTVTVNADVSSSSGTTTKTQYSTPTSAPVVSESTNDSTYSGSGASSAASGVLGTDTTDTSGTTTSGSGTGSTYKQTQGAKQNAVDEQTTTQSIVPGTLNRQTIAVAVNQSVLNKITTSALTTMVQNASGYNQPRGDLVSVTPVAFSNASAAAAKAALAQETAAASADQMSRIIQAAILVVGGLVGMILFFILLKKLFKRQEPMPMEAGVVNVLPVSPSGDPMYAGHSALGAAGAAGALGYGGAQHGLPPTMAMPQSELAAPAAFSQMQADVDALAGADPERTAEYLRALMGDGARV